MPPSYRVRLLCGLIWPWRERLGGVRRVMGTTRSYACMTQAGLTRLGSHVMRTSRVVLRVRSRRATTASLLPWRWVLQGLPRLEGRPQKPVPRAGAQLCAWTTRRELYQKVGNFVGSVISPVCANICLPEVLDAWVEQEGQPRMQGRGFLMRCADDGVMGCDVAADARRIMAVLPQRWARFGLRMPPTQTVLSACRKPSAPQALAEGPGTCDVLGWTHSWTRSRRGVWGMKRRTARKRARRTTQSLWRWCRTNRHAPLQDQDQT